MAGTVDSLHQSRLFDYNADLITGLPPEVDKVRVRNAIQLLDDNDYMVYKNTRAGLTQSLTYACQVLGKRMLLVSPTTKIGTETVSSAAGSDHVHFAANSACKKLKDKIEHKSIYGDLPLSLPDCNGCVYREGCDIGKMVDDYGAQIHTITYSKLVSVMLSDSKTAECIQTIMEGVDVVCLDEGDTLNKPNTVTVDFDTSILETILMAGGSKYIKLAAERLEELKNDIRNDEDLFYGWLDESDEEHAQPAYASFPYYNSRSLNENELKFATGQLLTLVNWQHRNGLTDKEILQIRDVIALMGNKNLTLTTVKINGVMAHQIKGDWGIEQRVLHDFFKKLVPGARAIIVSGTLYEKEPGYFEGLIGRPLTSYIYPDIHNTNSKMTIYADGWSLHGKMDWMMSKIDQIVNRIKKISEREGNQPIFLIAQKKELAAEISARLNGEFPNITINYYRSAESTGVAHDQRIGIAVGLAQTPMTSCDYCTSCQEESQKLRLQDVDAASWQAWSRIKDPAGKEDSRLYCIGVKANDAQRVSTWGIDRIVDLQTKTVSCTKELERPKLMMPQAEHRANPSRRSCSELIERVWKVEDSGDLLKKSTDRPIDVLCLNVENLSNFGVYYNTPKTFEEREQTKATQKMLFINNKGHYAQQNCSPGADGRYGYARHEIQDLDSLLDRVFDGDVTMAAYCFDPDGLTTVCMCDFDSHDPSKPPSEDQVRSAVKYLESLGIPCLVEASGSLHSYHLWIPIIPTSPKLVRVFLKQLLRDMDAVKTEIFPAQGSVSPKHPYGNPVKLPGSINRKTGTRSKFVDPHTLEPVERVVIDRLLELRDPGEGAEEIEGKRFIPVSQDVKLKPRTRSSYGKAGMRPCIQKILDDKIQLNEGDGHKLRIAIVTEALAAGKSKEDIIEMFKYQEDYDYSITEENVCYIRGKEYSPFTCEKLEELGICEGCGKRAKSPYGMKLVVAEFEDVEVLV